MLCEIVYRVNINICFENICLISQRHTPPPFDEEHCCCVSFHSLKIVKDHFDVMVIYFSIQTSRTFPCPPCLPCLILSIVSNLIQTSQTFHCLPCLPYLILNIVSNLIQTFNYLPCLPFVFLFSF